MNVIDNVIYSLTPITLYLSNCACNKVSDLQSDKVTACVFSLLNHKLPYTKKQMTYTCIYFIEYS